ncbi:MAG: AMP-binding protein [Paracoccaceae bacterium]|nr:AMP-binding protein [Paracoccaceae bacterium]
MLPAGASFESLASGFRWRIPDRYNIARDVCDRWARDEPDRTAIIGHSEGTVRDVTFGELRNLADRMAHRLRARGVGPGDRVGVLMTQSAATAAAHIAIWKLGAVSMPLSRLFGEDGLAVRLSDAGVRAMIVDGEDLASLRGAISRMPNSVDVLTPDGSQEQWSDRPTDPVESADTSAEDPAILMYTSGTTGTPKGALHAHRVLLGHLPGIEISHDLLPQPGDVIWTPADWSWIGGLLDVLMPGLHHGIPVVASRFRKFTGEATRMLIEDAGVRCVFFPPTALRMLRAEDCRITGLRSVACGGEPLGAEMLDWGQAAFGVGINEFYGQTECNMIVSSSGALFPHRPGWTGRPVPGHEVAVVDGNGIPIVGSEGEIAVRKGTPVMMLGYWKRPEATREKFRDDWMLTGDLGISDGEFIRFLARRDDVITSAGYRIGPVEIEDCLLTHDAVASVGVTGKPDPERTEIVKAYVVLRDGVAADETTASALKTHVRSRFAAHAFPREVEFVDSLPMTVTGKIRRSVLRQRAERETDQHAATDFGQAGSGPDETGMDCTGSRKPS